MNKFQEYSRENLGSRETGAQGSTLFVNDLRRSSIFTEARDQGEISGAKGVKKKRRVVGRCNDK